MTDLERIESSDKLKMALSELLFEKLFPEKCWHKYERKYKNLEDDRTNFCTKCLKVFQVGLELARSKDTNNPNLFDSEGIGFFKVWRAVKDRDWFIRDVYQGAENLPGDDFVSAELIEAPLFQFRVLQKFLEQDNEGERLEEILRKKRKTPYERQLP